MTINSTTNAAELSEQLERTKPKQETSASWAEPSRPRRLGGGQRPPLGRTPLYLGAGGAGHRHVDADHIAAIDNVTRKLMQEGKRPVIGAGGFVIGCSVVVILAAPGIALTTPEAGRWRVESCSTIALVVTWAMPGH